MNNSSLIESVTKRFPDGVSASHTYRGDATVVLRPDALGEKFGAAGVDMDKPVITSCGSGVTACILALGLHLVGHRDVAVYDGSWSEWGASEDAPIET